MVIKKMLLDLTVISTEWHSIIIKLLGRKFKEYHSTPINNHNQYLILVATPYFEHANVLLFFSFCTNLWPFNSWTWLVILLFTWMQFCVETFPGFDDCLQPTLERKSIPKATNYLFSQKRWLEEEWIQICDKSWLGIQDPCRGRSKFAINWIILS